MESDSPNLVISGSRFEDFWTGLTDMGHPGLFQWMHSRRDPVYTAWIETDYPVEPSERDPQLSNSCVILDSDSGNELRWRNFYCEHYRALPICEADVEEEEEEEVATDVPDDSNLPSPFL